MKVYGIASAEIPDKVNETAVLKGMDIAPVPYINDEHGDAARMFNVLGSIQTHKKIYSASDCANEREKRCWNHAKVPFLYVEGSLADEEEHPNAQAASALIKYAAQTPGFNLGFSVEGSVMEKEGDKLTKTAVRGVSLTISPCNPLCKVFSMDDLAKSYYPVVLPEKYQHLVSSGKVRSSFVRTPDLNVLLKSKLDFVSEVSVLLKSNQLNRARLLKCWNCGCQKVYIAPKVPNNCVACGEAFSMKDLSTALLSKKGDFE